jgi:uncharacterized protein YjlB
MEERVKLHFHENYSTGPGKLENYHNYHNLHFGTIRSHGVIAATSRDAKNLFGGAYGRRVVRPSVCPRFVTGS